MFLTVVLFYLTYIQVSYTLPPLANVYRNNADNLQNRYNERLLQRAILEEQNAYRKGSYNYQPTNIGTPSNFNAGQSTVASSPRALEIMNQNRLANIERLLQNQFRQETPNIRIPPNYENLFKHNILFSQGNNLAKQYGSPQNFKINVRGYVADINNEFVPLKPLSVLTPTQKTQPTGVNVDNVNRQTLKLPVTLPNKVTTVNAAPQSNKFYTIVHPNGTIEETNDFEYIKKNYPYYIVHDLSEKNTKKDNIAEKEVHAGNALAKPTVVPIYNLQPVQPISNMNQKETLVPNTLGLTTQSPINTTKIDESVMANANSFNKANLTAPQNISKSGSEKLYTSIVESVQSIKSNNSNNSPVVDETIISPSEIIKAPEESQDTSTESDNLYQDNENEMREKISAIDFWKEMDVIEMSDEKATADINKENPIENLETPDSSKDAELTTNSPKPNLELTSENDDNITDIDYSYEVFNTDPEIVEDFVSSIEDRIEFIKPFLIENETEDQEPDAIDKLQEISVAPGNSPSNASSSESEQAITNPIYIPHISLVKDDDDDSSFWFMTNDKKALEKLSPQESKNVTSTLTLTDGVNKTSTIHTNGTQENTTFEEKKLAVSVGEKEIKSR